MAAKRLSGCVPRLPDFNSNMRNSLHSDLRVGILGGGQLGRMLIQSGIDFAIPFSVLDPDPIAPCHSLADFTVGKLTDYDTVMRFGENCDVITIELENVNAKALSQLEGSKKVFPQPAIIEMIQDKRRQKQFFVDKGIPTAKFFSVQNRKEAMTYATFLPAVNKLAREGYDGRGVRIIKNEEGLKEAFDAPGLLEQWVDIDKEIAVIVARNERGGLATYSPVEMVFQEQQNILEHLIAPAQISPSKHDEAVKIAQRIITELQMVGVLAVEMFLTPCGQILVNELAPRPHNSGHYSIEACSTSQYEQHLRAILNLPPGDTTLHSPAAMVNLLGQAGHEGLPVYNGLDEVLSMEGTHLHLYGKQQTRPFRKMGHITILDDNVERLKNKANFVRQKLTITT